jgi:exonuclease SbcC
MKPVSLTLENIRSFRAKRTIDFANMQLFAVLGDTGAGKTSILEAMTYALYNRTTYSGTNTKELIAEGAPFMRVEFTFTVGETAYHLRRIARAKGVSEHHLECPALGLERVGETEVNKAICTALGMNYMTFIRTVLLPQGEHAYFLTATDGKKSEIVEELFHLTDIAEVDALAQRLEPQVRIPIHQAKTDRERYPADVPAAIAQTEEALRVAGENLAAAEKARETAAALDVKGATLTATLAGYDCASKALGAIQAGLTELEALHTRKGALDLQVAAAKAALDAARVAKASVDTEQARLESEHASTTQLRPVETLLADIARDCAEITKERIALASTVSSGDQAAKRVALVAPKLAAAATALADARIAEQNTARRLAALDGQQRDVADAIAKRERAAVDLATVQTAVGEAEREEAAVGQGLAAASAALETARIAKEGAERAFDEAHQLSGVAAVAEHLLAGDDCPICQQKLPASFVPPQASPKQASLLKAREAAGVTYQRAFAHQTSLTERTSGMEKATAAARKQSTKAEATFAAVEAEGTKMLPGGCKDLAALVASLDAERATLTQSHADARDACAAREREHQDLRDEHTKAQTESTSYAGQVAAVQASVADRLARNEDRAKSLPAAYAVEPDGAGIKEAQTALDRAIAAAGATDRILAAATAALARAEADCATAEREQSKLFAPRATIYATLRTAANTLDMLAPAEGDDEDGAWAGALAQQAQGRRGELAEQAVATRESLEDVRTERSVLIATLGSEPHDAVTRKAIARRELEQQLEVARAAADQVAQLEERIATLQPVHSGLSSLHTALGARNFLVYAREQRSRRLLEQATLILKEMTQDRFEFSKDFQIFDREMNGVRSAQTLSGGEKFLAALALSLAVVEIAASAGAKIESLFLDEGFASLDADALTNAMMALRKRAQRGRMIGVISHLREVGDYVDGTFRVDKQDDGSFVTYADGPLDETLPLASGLVTKVIVG